MTDMLDDFEARFLVKTVGLFDDLETSWESFGGVPAQDLAKALAAEFGVDSSFVESPEYHGSPLHFKVLQAAKRLDGIGLVKFIGASGGEMLSPTPEGRATANSLEREERSGERHGRKLAEHLYGVQGDRSIVHRRNGLAGDIDVDEVCKALGIERSTYERGARWAIRQGFLEEMAFDQAEVANGAIYITDEGMNAVDRGFAQSSPASVSQTFNVSNSQIYGSLVAAGRNALTIQNVGLAARADDIQESLAAIQDAIDNNLPQESDERHDALQEIHSLSRELSKPMPAPERVRQAINSLGAITSIGTVVATYGDRILELIQRIPGG